MRWPSSSSSDERIRIRADTAAEGPGIAPGRPAPPPHRWSEYVVLLALALLLLAALFGKLFVDPFFYFSTDNAELYFPWLVMLGRALHRGYWPFLNPYAFAGSLPFAPLESGAMYPVTLLAAAITSPRWSLDSIYFVFLGLSFLHYLLGACSMYLLLRRGFRLGAAAATFGALCYAFGGSFLGRFPHQPVLFGLAWLPLAVGGALAFTEGGALRSAALAVVALWLLGTASHPQIFLYGFAVVAVTVAWFSLTGPRGLRGAALRRGASVLAIALGLLAPRLLPLYELSRVIVRPTVAFTMANLFDALSPLYYLTLVIPGLFGRHLVGYWGTDHPFGNWDSLLYVGVLPALCACFCFFHRRRRDWGFALVGTGAAFFLMLGPHWTVSAWVVRHLPLSDVLTGLSKFTIVFHFFFVLLAAFGAEALLVRGRGARIVGMAAGAGLLVVALFAWLSPDVVGGLAPAGRRPPSQEAVRFAVQSVGQARWVALVSVATLFSVILAPRMGRALLIPVLVADLALSLGTFNPIEVTRGEPARYYGGDATTRLMQGDQDVFRVANLTPPNGGLVFELDAMWGYHTIFTSAYARIQRFLDVRDRSGRSIYNLANIKYHRLGADISSYNFAPVTPGLWLNQEMLPRAFFVGRCLGFPDEDAMTHHVLSQPFNPSRELLLLASDCRRDSHADGSCALRSAAESGERYTADCTAGEDGGWAFFSVLQYPGWTSTVDGRAAALVPADIGFYAVPVSAGRHRVELIHHSRSLWLGVWIAVVTGVLAVGLAVWRERRDRPSAPGDGGFPWIVS